MKTLITFILALLAVSVEAASPSFTSFNNIEFGTDGRSAIWMTNQYLSNVMVYGAKCDGVTDDTAAIQAAVNAGNVFFPYTSNLCVISSAISIPSDRLIVHVPGSGLFRKASTWGGSSTNEGFYLNNNFSGGNSNITIVGGTFNGNQANQTAINFGAAGTYVGGVGMRFYGVSNLIVRDVEIDNNLSFGLQIGNVTNLTVDNIRFNWSGTGLHQDAVHLNGGIANFKVSQVWSSGGNDDTIALNADDVSIYQMVAGNISNGIVENVFNLNNGTPASSPGIRLLNYTHNITDVMVKDVRGYFAAGRAITCTADAGSPSGYIDRVTFRDFDVVTPPVDSGFMWWTLNAGSITLDNCRWHAGYTTADGYGNGEYFFDGLGGTITNLTIKGPQIIADTTNTTPFYFNLTSISNLIVSDVTLTRPSGTAQTGNLFGLTSSIGNVQINGVSAPLVNTIYTGSPTGQVNAFSSVNMGPYYYPFKPIDEAVSSLGNQIVGSPNQIRFMAWEEVPATAQQISGVTFDLTTGTTNGAMSFALVAISGPTNNYVTNIVWNSGQITATVAAQGVQTVWATPGIIPAGAHLYTVWTANSVSIACFGAGLGNATVYTIFNNSALSTNNMAYMGTFSASSVNGVISLPLGTMSASSFTRPCGVWRN